MIILEDLVQNTPEWFQEKLGKPSASKFKEIITTTGKRTAKDTWWGYLYKLAGEVRSGHREQDYQSREMKEGIEREPLAREHFQELYKEEVRQVGLVYKDNSRSVLCSPDGLMNGCGLEIKNRNLKNHTRHLVEGVLPYDAIVQVQGSMYVTGLKHWFYFSWYPGMPPFILLVKRDDEFIAKLDKEVKLFCKELKDTIKKLKKL